jgi:hypothetical protein
MVPNAKELLDLRVPPGQMLLCLKMATELGPKCHVSLTNHMMDKVQQKRRRLCQITLVMLRSLFHLHMTIWQCRPWFGSAWSGLEQSSLAQSGTAQHLTGEFKMTSHI